MHSEGRSPRAIVTLCGVSGHRLAIARCCACVNSVVLERRLCADHGHFAPVRHATGRPVLARVPVVAGKGASEHRRRSVVVIIPTVAHLLGVLFDLCAVLFREEGPRDDVGFDGACLRLTRQWIG
ncbi:hypothetical protein MRX96_021440 [Rhipicephalus microplus]